MQFLLLIYDQEQRAMQRTKAEKDADHHAFLAFNKDFATAIKGGNALKPSGTAQTVRLREGKAMVTDGPFAETKEQLAGYYLIEAHDVGEAAAVAAKIPWARFGSIEVRPILTFS